MSLEEGPVVRARRKKGLLAHPPTVVRSAKKGEVLGDR
jgi:hypothetical protein